MDIISYAMGKKAGGGGSTPVLQDKEIEITQNGETTVRADSGYDGLSSVEVTTNVPQPSGTKSIDENGTYDVTNYASAEVNVPTGSPEVPKKQVNFYDYEGNRVYSYTIDEALALNALPSGPTHDTLNFTQWNWTLTQLKNYLTEVKTNVSQADINEYFAPVNIGEECTTKDGKTCIYIDLDDSFLDIYMYLTGFNNLSAIVDWGDGSSTDTYGPFSNQDSYTRAHHIYSQAGKYKIKIQASGTLGMIYVGKYYNYNSYGIISNDIDNYTNPYNKYIYKVEFGNNVSLRSGQCLYFSKINASNFFSGSASGIGVRNKLKFLVLKSGLGGISNDAMFTDNHYCSDWAIQYSNVNGYELADSPLMLKEINLNSYKKVNSSTGSYRNTYANRIYLEKLFAIDLETIRNSEFTGNSRMSKVYIPNALTLGQNSFQNTTSLTTLNVPKVTSIGQYCFSNSGLAKIKLRDITTINNYAFYNCKFLKEIDCSECSAVPTLGTSVFQNVYASFKVVVPDSLYEEWIAANNWSSISSNIVKASEYTE